MPAYGVQNPLPSDCVLTTGIPTPVWENELVGVGESSLQVVIPNEDKLPRNYAVELVFTESDGVTPAAPGAFEVDLQHASTDEDSRYVTAKEVTSGLNASNVLRVEMTGVVAKFARLQMVALANPVYVTATYTK